MLIGTRRALIGSLGQDEPLWTPDQDGSDVKAWWTCKDAGSITDAAGAVITDGGAVANWYSQRGGFVASQGTAAARPAYSATGWDGLLPAITGDGASSNGDILGVASPSAIFAGDQSIFIVAQRGTQGDSATSGQRTLLSTAASSGGAVYTIRALRPTLDPGQTQVEAGTNGGTGSVTIQTPFADGQRSVIFTQFSASDIRVAIDGGALSTAGAIGTGFTTSTVFNLFGDQANAARRFAGKIVEVVIYQKLLTLDEIALRVAGLAYAWRIQ